MESAPSLPSLSWGPLGGQRGWDCHPAGQAGLPPPAASRGTAVGRAALRPFLPSLWGEVCSSFVSMLLHSQVLSRQKNIFCFDVRSQPMRIPLDLLEERSCRQAVPLALLPFLLSTYSAQRRPEPLPRGLASSGPVCVAHYLPYFPFPPSAVVTPLSVSLPDLFVK